MDNKSFLLSLTKQRCVADPILQMQILLHSIFCMTKRKSVITGTYFRYMAVCTKLPYLN